MEDRDFHFLIHLGTKGSRHSHISLFPDQWARASTSHVFVLLLLCLPWLKGTLPLLGLTGYKPRDTCMPPTHHFPLSLPSCSAPSPARCNTVGDTRLP